MPRSVLSRLQIDGVDAPLPAIPPGDTATPQTGATVFAIRHPLGLGWSLTQGIVSGRRASPAGTPLIQIDASISPGNSGGPPHGGAR